MTQTPDAPSHNRFSHFRCEEGVITRVFHNTYTVTVETVHSAKTVPDVTIANPYHHPTAGEGWFAMPEVGALVWIAFPSDNTPPFVLGYRSAPGVLESEDGRPLRTDTGNEEGTTTDFTYRSHRLELFPGDQAWTGRDGNYLILKRGGVVQVGATAIAQRLYLPVLNYIRDFAENYSLDTFAGDVRWNVERQEADPSGNAPGHWRMHVNGYAQDQYASVRIRHMSLAEPGDSTRGAWDVVVAPNSINRETGEVTSAVYTLLVTTAGEKTEVMAARKVTVKGNDELTVEGDLSIDVHGKATVSSQGDMKLLSQANAVVGGRRRTLVGGDDASHNAVYGELLVQWLASQQWPVAPVGGSLVAAPSPAQIGALQNLLSRAVFVK